MERGCQILLVEDHADTRKALALWLGYDEFSVMEADGCAAALSLARQHRFDPAICDIQLSDGDGCDLLGELQQIFPVPGIAVTGHGREQDIRRCLDAGFRVHILKPFEYSTLRDAIHEVLHAKQTI